MLSSKLKSFKPNDNHSHYYKRDTSQQALDNLTEDLRNIDWGFIYHCNDVNNVYNDFIHVLSTSFNKHCKLKRASKKNKTIRSPWLTPGIFNSIKSKNKLYKEYIHNPTDNNKIKFTVYRNKLTSIIRFAKKNYYKNLFESNKNNLAKTWQTINNVIGCAKPRSNNIKIKHNNNILTNDHEIANAFNDFFTSVGPNLASKIPSCSNSFHDYFPFSNISSFFLTPANIADVINIIQNLPKKSAPGVDTIPTSILQQNCFILAAPLTYIINLSFENGIFPDHLKLARVTPIFKSGDSQSVSNYRPISVLSTISKVFERIMYNKLELYLSKYDILSKEQFGFRKNYSTYMACLDLINFITTGFDNKEATLGVFIDLSKAFDTVDHGILLDKLRYCGVRGIAHKWFESYLTNRKQLVNVNHSSSTFNDITCGVPQGSILGPLLFLLFINDLPNCSNVLKFVLFADDTSILFKNSDPRSCIPLLNDELQNVSIWFKANKLSLNIKKTNFMIFQSKPSNFADLDIIIDGSIIKQVDTVKFLGLFVDSRLSWKPHIDHLSTKIAKTIGILHKIKYFVPLTILQTLYFSLIFSSLSYCNLIWGNTFPTYLNRLFILQKRAIRLITSSDYSINVKSLFKNLNTPTLFDIYKHQLGSFMFKVHRNILPINFCKLFELNSNIHGHFTRHCSDYHLPSIKSEINRKSVIFTGTKFWNNLDQSLKNSSSVTSFNKKLKYHLLNNYS